MYHGLLPDSKIKGTVGRARHMAHAGQRGGRRSKGFLGIMDTLVKDLDKSRKQAERRMAVRGAK